MTKLSIYKIASEYRNLVDTLSNMDLDEQTVTDTLEAECGGILADKLVNLTFFMKELEATAAEIQLAEQQMAVRRKSIENRAQRIRSYIIECMRVAYLTHIPTPWFNIRRKKNNPSVVIEDIDAIPAEYMRQPELPPAVPDKKAISLALTEGREIPGASLNYAERLEVK